VSLAALKIVAKATKGHSIFDQKARCRNDWIGTSCRVTVLPNTGADWREHRRIEETPVQKKTFSAIIAFLSDNPENDPFGVDLEYTLRSYVASLGMNLLYQVVIFSSLELKL
jgi:hypothetical protein